jgi:hypothetical protein
MSRTIGIGAQHVVAMFGATFLVPLMAGFPPTTTIFFSGVGTLVFILATTGRGQRLGLPSYTGSSPKSPSSSHSSPHPQPATSPARTSSSAAEPDSAHESPCPPREVTRPPVLEHDGFPGPPVDVHRAGTRRCAVHHRDGGILAEVSRLPCEATDRFAASGCQQAADATANSPSGKHAS